MRVGFSGTRDDMTDAQRRAFIHWCEQSPAAEFHHGCCIGADETAWEVSSSREAGFPEPKPRVVAHPPTNRSLLCNTAEMFADEVRPAADYLVRNRAIVDACDVLLAAPKGPEEQRSGTWATVRHGRKQGKRIVLFWPDGSVTEESAK